MASSPDGGMHATDQLGSSFPDATDDQPSTWTTRMAFPVGTILHLYLETDLLSAMRSQL